ncbi:MAG: tRNA uridine(34) 5-carboxymethylaminomethyl modification radical SAM/GNAT enzyme Elp3 [Anaerolineae bacterium]|nr:tRNA uridine(34) 5-carboxymethylaminomethyl modification radical SAM/GNAT enzyme Elp3 [Anaerolineae bacterium]
MKSHYTFDAAPHREPLLAILRQVQAQPDLPRAELERLIRRHPRQGSGLFSRNQLIQGYRQLSAEGALPFDPAVIACLQRKPTRTISGVTPVTVLTRPYACPGTCIFCPNDVRMPKSYLSHEPGAQRAEQNAFDPYLQTYSRLLALRSIGHSTDKVEIIILGGTWSFYPEPYQIWFVKRVFDALHDFGRDEDRRAEVEAALADAPWHPANLPDEALDGRHLAQTYNQRVARLYAADAARVAIEFATWQELAQAHRENEQAPCRCVGLVIETRPDYLDEAEAIRLRRLGCTKIQIGIQSMNDEVLRLNRRGHTTQRTREALRALRQAGFKLHAHWMPNLYGADPASDAQDFARLFSDPDIQPDELKVYPCSLIESAELMQYYEHGLWRPYEEAELLEVLVGCFASAPPYVRLTRVIRDIPSTDIVVGNKKTNFREIVEHELAARGITSREIRSREIRDRSIQMNDLHLEQVRYSTSVGDEVFLQFITSAGQIAGFAPLAACAAASGARTNPCCHDPRSACVWESGAPGREPGGAGATSGAGGGNSSSAPQKLPRLRGINGWLSFRRWALAITTANAASWMANSTSFVPWSLLRVLLLRSGVRASL